MSSDVGTAVDEPVPTPEEAPAPPSGWKKFRWGSGRTWFIIVTSAILVYLIIGPVAILAFSSLRKTEQTLPFTDQATWTLGNYADVFLSGNTYRVLWDTLVFSAGTLVLSFALAVALAWLVERTDLPFRRSIYTMVIAQIGIPAVISSISWALLLSPRQGFVNIGLRSLLGMDGEGPLNVFSMTGMIVVQSVTLVPITFLLISAAFRAMDASLEEAAAVAGARFPRILRRVTLPVLMPALLSAAVYQMVTIIETADIPLVIGLRAGILVLSTLIFFQVNPASGLPNYGLASAYSVLVLVIAVTPLLYYNYVIARSERYSTITGRAYRRRRYSLGRGRRWALAGVGVYLMVGFILPIGALLWTSLQPYLAVPSFDALSRLTFDHYLSAWGSSSTRTAALNSGILGVGTALGTMVLGLCVAWVIVRSRSRWGRMLDVIAFLPHAFPGVIIGLAILLVYLTIPNPLYGTIWIMVLALSTQYTSLSTRLMGSSIAQINAELEEAAEISGARWRQVLRRITLPLVYPPFFNGMLLICLMAIKSLTLPLMLYESRSVVLPVLIYIQWEDGRTGWVGAVSVCMVAVALVLGVIARRFGEVGAVR